MFFNKNTEKDSMYSSFAFMPKSIIGETKYHAHIYLLQIIPKNLSEHGEKYQIYKNKCTNLEK